MITNKGKRICDYEYRNKKGLWCGCRKQANFRVKSKVVRYLELDYCKHHAAIKIKNGVLNERR